MLRKTKNVDFTVLDVGTEGSSGFGPSGNSNNVALFTLHLPNKAIRVEDSLAIAEDLRKTLATFASPAKLNVVEIENGGPPAGADLAIKLSGDDLGKLSGYADQLVSYLQKQPGVTNPDKSIKPGTSALVFVPDPDKLSAAGVTVDQVAGMLRTYASGFTLDQVNFDGGSTTDKLDVTFSLGYDRPSVESLGRISIPTQIGTVPLLSLGQVETKSNPTVITREAGKRTISVTAAVSSGYSVSEKNQELQKQAEALHLPDG